MSRASPLLSSFNAGELSPRLGARVDVGKVASGCKVMENYIPMIQGPAMRRCGTRFIAEVKDSTARTWLVRFEFNVQQAYVAEFGHLYIRFYTQHGQLLATGAAAYAGATTYALDDYVTYGAITYRSLQAGNVGHQPDISPAWWSAQSIYEITSPYSASDLTASDGTFNLRIVESADVLYLCHASYAPRKLSRVSATSWSLATLTPTGGPFKDVNTTTTTVYASAQTGSVTVTASSAIFTSAIVGSLFYIERNTAANIPMWVAATAGIAAGARCRADGRTYTTAAGGTTGNVMPTHTEGSMRDGVSNVIWTYEDPGYGYGIITAYTDSTHVTMTVIDAIPYNAVGAGQATTKWAFGAWSGVEGWPDQVTFYKERLTFARGQHVWMSQSGDYENFHSKDKGGLVVADSAISIQVQSDQVNNIRWMMPFDSLLVGTAGSEFAVQPLTLNQVFGPDNVTAPPVSGFGSKWIMPARVGDYILFVQRSGIKLREINYDFLSNKFVSKDKTVLSDHITQGGLIQLSYQQEPYSLVWASRVDGHLICFTYNREQEVEGWSRHPLGGSGIVESITTIPNPDGDCDDLWMIVRRTINGTTRRYVEYLEVERIPGSDVEDAFFVDCGLTLNNTQAATLTPAATATADHSTGVVFTAGSAIFAAGDVGKEIHYRYTTTAVDESGISQTAYKTAKALITGYTDTTHVTCTINAAFPSTATIASGGWRMTVTSISGLSHLEGQTVQVLADGGSHPDCVVSGGSITLNRPASKVQVGLSCPAKLQTMRLNAVGNDGTSQGKTARINKAVVRVHESLGLKFGHRFDQLDEVDFRTPLMDMDVPPDLFSGDLVLDWPGEYDTHPWLCFQADQPFPSTIIGVAPTVSTYDRG